MRKKLAFLAMFVLMALLLGGCTSKEPRDIDIKKAISSIIESESNPLNGRYESFEYELISEYKTDTEYRGTYYISEDSKRSHIEMEAILYFTASDNVWIFEDASLNTTKVCPLNPPDKALVEKDMCSRYNIESPCKEWSLSVDEHTWDAQDPGTTDKLSVSFVRTCDTYLQTIHASIIAQWNEREEIWILGTTSNDYSVISTEYDFSRINGRWEGTWTDKKEQVPLWFEISNAGIITVSKDKSTNKWTTVNLEHNLNEARNNNTNSVFFSQFTTGSVQLTVDGTEKEPSIYITISYPGDSSTMSDTTLGVEPTGLAYFDVFRTNLSCTSEREEWPRLNDDVEADTAMNPQDKNPAEEYTTPENHSSEQDNTIQFAVSKRTVLIICAVVGGFAILVASGLLIIKNKRKFSSKSGAILAKPDRSTENIWYCSKCGAANVNQFCNRCGTHRTEKPVYEYKSYTEDALNPDKAPITVEPPISGESHLKKGRWESASIIPNASTTEGQDYFHVPDDLK